MTRRSPRRHARLVATASRHSRIMKANNIASRENSCAGSLLVMVQNAVSTVPGVGKVDVSVVWDPPWDPSRMSEEARVVLNML